MKQKLWLTIITGLAYCIDKEFYKAIDHLREQVRVLVEQQEKQNKRNLLTNSQRMRVASKAKRLSRKRLSHSAKWRISPAPIVATLTKDNVTVIGMRKTGACDFRTAERCRVLR